MSWKGELARRRRAAVGAALRGAWRYAEQAGAITADSAAGRRFAAFGAESMIAFPAGTVYGERWIEIGAATTLAAHVTVCAGMSPGHDLGPAAVLRIGDRCVVGRGSHIVAQHRIDIGDHVFAGPYVYITDQNHGYADPDTPIGAQWPVNHAVSIGAGTWLGTGAIILPGAVLGQNVVVAAGAVVRGQVPDRCVVAGVPARIVREYVPGAGWMRPRRRTEPAAEATGGYAPKWAGETAGVELIDGLAAADGRSGAAARLAALATDGTDGAAAWLAAADGRTQQRPGRPRS